MKEYTVEQYELHVATYKVLADSEADAVALVRGGGEHIESVQYIGVLEDLGMEVSEALKEQLESLGVSLKDGKVPSIRAVRG